MLLCYGNTLHTREMHLSFPAADAAAPLLLCAVVLWCCTSANWCGYVITGKAALLHLACAAPQAAPLAGLGLAWVEEFKLSLSLCLS